MAALRRFGLTPELSTTHPQLSSPLPWVWLLLSFPAPTGATLDGAPIHQKFSCSAFSFHYSFALPVRRPGNGVGWDNASWLPRG